MLLKIKIMFRVPSAGLGPADFWFEAKYDIQFHHEGKISVDGVTTGAI